jgi:hypothetical protein
MKQILPFILLMWISTLSNGNTVETKANITNVTVYTSSAEMHYEKAVKLEAGSNTVVFTNLTPFIVENTINISASNPSVNIMTVTEKINYISEKTVHNKTVKKLKDSITFITREVGLLRCKTETLQKEKELLIRDGAIGGVANGTAVEEIEKASAFFQKRYYEVTTELFHLEEKVAALDKRSGKYRNQVKQMSRNGDQATSEIRLSVSSPTKQTVTFNFKHLTTKGGWAPAYDFKYKGPEEPLQFIFRANVFNACGIPWKDVKIKLSTADPIRGFDLPTLNEDVEKKGKPTNYTDNGVTFNQIEVVNAIAEYDIAHNYTIPSNAKPYLVEVNAFTVQANYNYLVIPKLDPFGFLMAKIPDWNKHNLIPGTTNIYNKGTYMGKTFLNTYAETDTLSLFLGKDKSIQSTRKEINDEHPRNFIGNNYVDKTSIDITIKNSDSKALAVEVIDQVPLVNIADRAKLNVSNIMDAFYDEPDGLLTWKFSLEPGATKEIHFKYELKVPKEHYEHYKPRKRSFRTISCPSF